MNPTRRAFVPIALIVALACATPGGAQCPRTLGVLPHGQVDAVAAVGADGAAIGSGHTLQVVDLSDPAAPRVTGELDVGAFVQALAVDGSTAYVGTFAGLHAVDISDRRRPRLLGEWLGGGVEDVVAARGAAFLARRTTGIVVLDVSDPGEPAETAVLDRPGSVYGLALSGDILASAERDPYIGVFDVSDLSAPTQIGALELPGRDLFDIDIAGDRAAVADSDGALVMIDLSAPEDPTVTGSVAGLTEPHEVVLDGNLAYVAEYGQTLAVVDVSDPAHPRVVGDPGFDDAAYCDDVAVGAGHVLLAQSSAALLVVDATDAARPSLVGRLRSPGTTYDIELLGSTALAVDSSIGLRTIDLSDPDRPREMGRTLVPEGARAVEVVGGVAVVAGDEIGTYDLTDPAAPRLMGSFDVTGAVRDLELAGTIAYAAAGSDGLRIVDVSDPGAPAEIAAYASGGFARGVTVAGGYAYLAADQAGLEIVDVSDPTAPTLAGSIDTPDYAADVSVVGDAALVSDLNSLQVIDVSDRSNPTLVDSLESVSPSATELAGNLLLVAQSTSVAVLDVTDPRRPTEIGLAGVPGFFGKITARGALIGSPMGGSGFAVLAFDGCVGPDRIPVADFDWTPAAPVAGLPVRFEDLSVGDAGSRTWTLGDGATATGERPVHTYGAGGEYVVTLEATGPSGTGSASRTLVVSPSSAPPVDSPGSLVTLVPAGAHVEGLEGTRWVTDLVLHATDPSDATANVYFLQDAADNSGAVGRQLVVPAGTSLRLADVVLSSFGSTSATGALLVGSDRPLLVSSRTYNAAGDAGTYGQYIAGQPSEEALLSGADGLLLQLAHAPGDDGFRTNIGVASLSGSPTTVAVDLFRGDGTPIRTFAVELGPYGFRQVGQVFRGHVSGVVAGAWAVVRSSSPGARFLAYGSVVDNGSGDPIYVPARTPPEAR